jgi:hypothetical protein
MTIHETFMRKASLLLFWAAIVTFILGFAIPLSASMPAISPYGGSENFTVLQFLNAVHGGVSSAILPFIGSAVVWFMQDRKGGAA